MSAELTPETIAAALGVALAPAATPEQRAAGAALARAIVAQLEPSAPPTNSPPSAIPIASPLSEPQPPNLAGMLHDVLAQLNARSPEQRMQLRKLGPDLLLDLAITKLRAAVPDGATAPAPVGAFNVRLVGVPGSATKAGP